MAGVRKREWGGLEDEVMQRLHEQEHAVSARELQRTFSEPVPAYTTVMTVLDRLAKKGVVLRRLDGRAWLYEPARSRLDLYVATVEEALASLEPQERTQVLRTLLDGALAASTK